MNLRFLAAFVFVIAVVAAAATLACAATATGDQLVMFVQEGCPYCAAWNREIGRIYAKTDEGKRLPLRRVDIHEQRPADLRAIAGVRFTPTFVVLHCGHEAGRIVGYASQGQFWMLLDEDLKAIESGSPAHPGCP